MNNKPLALVISLENANLRRNNAAQELSKSKFEWQFIDAIDGRRLNNPPPEYKGEKVRRLLGFELTPSELGCFLSHKSAWQICIQEDRPVIVLEDDFKLLDGFDANVEGVLMSNLSWDIFRLQALKTVAFDYISSLPTKAKIVRNHYDPLGSTAYMIHPISAAKLIEHSQEIFEPVDHFLEHTSYHNLKILSLNPYPVSISEVASTINDRPPRLPVKGLQKKKRSFYRMIDRLISSKPWFK